MYIVYMIECHDRTLYTGITNDLPRRFELHKTGRASRYTRSHPPRRIVYTEECQTKSDALKREIAIKRLTRGEKLTLISQHNQK